MIILVQPSLPCLDTFLSYIPTSFGIFTSATEGEGGYVFTPFCLFVCLCTRYLKKLWTDPNENLWTGWVCDKDEQIRFW